MELPHLSLQDLDFAAQARALCVDPATELVDTATELVDPGTEIVDPTTKLAAQLANILPHCMGLGIEVVEAIVQPLIRPIAPLHGSQTSARSTLDRALSCRFGYAVEPKDSRTASAT